MMALLPEPVSLTPIPWTRRDERAYEQARQRLLDEWGAELREHLALNERIEAPRRSDRIGPMEQLVTTLLPAPSSKQKRYEPPPLHRCMNCPTMIDGHWQRCPECRKMRKRGLQRENRRAAGGRAGAQAHA
jgi:hypothetical protein